MPLSNGSNAVRDRQLVNSSAGVLPQAQSLPSPGNQFRVETQAPQHPPSGFRRDDSFLATARKNRCRALSQIGYWQHPTVGIGHTWLQKLVWQFQADTNPMYRELRRSCDPSFAQLLRAREYKQLLRDRREVRPTGRETDRNFPKEWQMMRKSDRYE
jgi:hypothetical protein